MRTTETRKCWVEAGRAVGPVRKASASQSASLTLTLSPPPLFWKPVPGPVLGLAAE